MRVLSLALLLLASVAICFARVSCLDGSGSAVDWFAALKAPDGYTYYYSTGGALSVCGLKRCSFCSNRLHKSQYFYY